MDKLDLQSQQLLDDLSQVVNQMSSKLNNSTLLELLEESYAKVLYLAFFSKITRLFESIRILLIGGYGLEAFILMRPLFEVLIDWICIEKDPVILGERYLLYQKAAQLEWTRNHRNTVDVQKYISEKGDATEEFCNRYTKGEKLPIYWYGNVKKRALKAELNNCYEYIYSFQSDLIHNSPITLSKYIDVSNPGTLILNDGPEFYNIKGITAHVCIILGMCLEKMNQHFKLCSESEIESLKSKIEEYRNIQ